MRRFDACAQGRVWSGRQAVARGLVDRIGGVEEALAELKYRVGLPDHWPVGVERFPKPASLLRFPSLLRLLPWGGEGPRNRLALGARPDMGNSAVFSAFFVT